MNWRTQDDTRQVRTLMLTPTLSLIHTNPRVRLQLILVSESKKLPSTFRQYNQNLQSVGGKTWWEINLKIHATSYPFDFLFLCVPQTKVQHPQIFAVDNKLLGIFLQLSKQRFFFLIKHYRSMMKSWVEMNVIREQINAKGAGRLLASKVRNPSQKYSFFCLFFCC